MKIIYTNCICLFYLYIPVFKLNVKFKMFIVQYVNNKTIKNLKYLHM